MSINRKTVPSMSINRKTHRQEQRLRAASVRGEEGRAGDERVETLGQAPEPARGLDRQP
jgi:hypothetical protein